MKQYKMNRFLLSILILVAISVSYVLLYQWIDLETIDYIMIGWMGLLALISLLLPYGISLGITFIATLIYGVVVIFSGTTDLMEPIGISYYYLIIPTVINVVIGMVGQINRKYLRVSDSFESTYEALVRIDELTGFRNITEYHDNLEEEINRKVRHGSDLSLMLIHIESFDDLNKLYGYNQGQKFLKYLSEFVIELTRNVDKHYRIKDNVFALILPNTDHQGANILKERFIEELESVNIVVSKQEQKLDIDIDIVFESYKQEKMTAHQYHDSVQEQLAMK